MELWNIIIAAMVSSFFTLIVWGVKSTYDLKKKSRYSARLFSIDIKHTAGVLDLDLKSGVGFPIGALTLIPDWKELFAYVDPKLSYEESLLLLDYYRRIEHLEIIRKELVRQKILLENTSSSSLSLDLMMKIAPATIVGFKEQAQDVLCLDLQSLLNKLKKIS